MLRYIARRLFEVIPTTFGIIVLTFVLFNVVGGSSAEVVLGKNATKEEGAAYIKSLPEVRDPYIYFMDINE